MTCHVASLRLTPVKAVLVKAQKAGETEVALTKFVPKGKKAPRAATEVVGTEDPPFYPVGFQSALAERKSNMEAKGLQTELPNMSKEEKKADREKKKLLSQAKHLLK